MVDVPTPIVEAGRVIVRSEFSLISSGTELAAAQGRSQGLVKRALSNPDKVWSLVNTALDQGLGAAVDTAADSLQRWVPIGYSLAGIVEGVGSGVSGIRVGDMVSCAGAGYANHAEYVSIPQQLAVAVPPGVEARHAACAPVSAIAMQAVRRSAASIGEIVVVIGLGLVGLLTARLLASAGCRVVGMEPDADRLVLAERMGCTASSSNADGLAALVERETGGLGADAVIICAATDASGPSTLAGEMARERGRVVVVGDVGLEIDRELYYGKELDLVLSRSMGPGRYDREYEEGGRDYPPAHVRWTEARNVEACLALMADGRLDVGPLIEEAVPVDEAPRAFEILQQGKVATLIQYPVASSEASAKPSSRVDIRPVASGLGLIEVGLIGPGKFAGSSLLPWIKKNRGLNLRGLVGRSTESTRQTADRFGAAYASTDPAELLEDKIVDAIWIATPHNSHAELAIAALRAGKHVFVEKPLALTAEDAARVRGAVESSDRVLMVGFNRRFANASQVVSSKLQDSPGPKQVIYRVRGDRFEDDHWLDDQEVGGGRLVGEGVHFFDWMAWLLGEEPTNVYASGSETPPGAAEVLVDFSGGSKGVLVYTTLGTATTAKERVEVFGADFTAVIDNFERVSIERGGRTVAKRSTSGKGHAELFATFVSAVREGVGANPNATDGVRATLCALAATESLSSGKREQVSQT